MWGKKGGSRLDKEIDEIIDKTKIDEIQSCISSNICFRYNSVNVVIGKRGSGKTHFVLREILKLLLYPEANYTLFLYSSNKITNDDTVEKFKPLFEGSPLEIQIIKHDETLGFIDAIAQTKKDYITLKDNLKASSTSYELKEKTLRKLNIVYTKKSTPHTIIVIDDCIDLLTKRGELFKKLFENRPP
jgi:hypothetical protein